MKHRAYLWLTLALVATAPLLVLQTPAEAQTTISRFYSAVSWEGLSTDDKALVCPAGDGSSYMSVNVRDTDNLVIEGAIIELEFVSPCSLYAYPDTALTDMYGNARFYPPVGLMQAAGGCCSVTAKVWAEYPVGSGGWAVIQWPGAAQTDTREWRSFDMNADGVVNGSTSGWGDYGIFMTDWSTTNCRSNYVPDTWVGLADASMFNLHVIHPALRILPPDGIFDFGPVAQGAQPCTTLTLQNWAGGDGGGTIGDVYWQLTESCPWLTLSRGSGTIPVPDADPPAANATHTSDICINTTGLAAIDYTYGMPLTSTSDYEWMAPDTVWVHVTVLPEPADIDVASTVLNLEPVAGGSDSDTLVISNLGGVSLDWTITGTCLWTAPVPAAGTTAPGGSTEVEFATGDLSSLEAGVPYTGNFAVESNDPVDPSVPIVVNLEITQTTGIDSPFSVGIERNYPNPFSPSTAFRYTVPEPGAFVRISVFDLQGRVVRTLESEEKWAGEHTAVWHGRDDSGKNLGSGVYFYRVEIGQHHVTRKMVLMR